MTIDEIYLSEAVKEAQAGLKNREEPVGAVVVLAGRLAGRAHQQTRNLRDPTAHAVMIALTQATSTVEEGRLKGARLYATEMPCRMCLAAAQLTGVERIIYGVARKRSKSPRIRTVSGILKEECERLIS